MDIAHMIDEPQGPSADVDAFTTSMTVHPVETEAVPKQVPSYGNRFPIALRIQCLTLMAEKYKAEEIERKLGVSQRTLRRLKKRAKDRGFDPAKDPRILEKYVTDEGRPGRPKRPPEGATTTTTATMTTTTTAATTTTMTATATATTTTEHDIDPCLEDL